MRRCRNLLISVAETCAPAGFVNATDLVFHTPRFQLKSHVKVNHIPEVQAALDELDSAAVSVDSLHEVEAAIQRSRDAAAGMQSGDGRKRRGTPNSLVGADGKATYDAVYSTLFGNANSVQILKKAEDKALISLSRAQEIYDNIGAVSHSSPALVDAARSLYAGKIHLLNGFVPRPTGACHMHVHKAILAMTSKLLFHNDNWTRSDLQQIDVSCLVMAHFVKSFCALHQRPQNEQQERQRRMRRDYVPPSEWSLRVGDGEKDVVTLSRVMACLDDLIKICEEAEIKHKKEQPSLRWHVPKLMVMKGLLTIPHTGNLLRAQELVDVAADTVCSAQKKKKAILDALADHPQEAELGLFMLMQAEAAARTFDWDIEEGKVDRAILDKYEDATKFYASQFNHAMDSDGVMDESKISERGFETEAYVTCLLSYANFLHGAPRPKGATSKDKPVFLPKQVFSSSPLLNVDSSSDMIYADVQMSVKMSTNLLRKHTGEALERGLKLNRAQYPEHRLNPKAGALLLSMASLYADTRDYLYATGLFTSAEKAIIASYGEASLEHIAELRLRYEFLAGVGSDQEAKTAANEIVHLLKRMDALPY